jgi:ClpP class serine protease
VVEVDALLSAGIVAAVCLNALTSFYLIRRLQPPRERTIETSDKKEEDTEEDTDDEEEEEGGPSKDEILTRRAQLIHEIEQERGTRIITLIHRKEPWTKGDDEPEIVLEDSETILQEVRETPPDKPIDFILHTPGGVGFAAEMIAMALKYHQAKVTVMVPFYAFSNGSYLALAGDEIMMEKYSSLAPVEPQVDEMPASAIMSILKRKPIETISDRTILLAESARMEMDNAREFVKWLLLDKMNEDQATQVANFLVGGVMASTTPITLDVARAIGLNVTEGVPEKVHQIFETLEFSGQRPGKAYQ